MDDVLGKELFGQLVRSVHLADLIGKNENAFELLRSTHHILSYLLFAIAVLHILAALKHHFWDKDDVLLRMLPLNRPEKAKSEK
jgi:cytochrome b561